MSFMFEVYYPAPVDHPRESRISEVVARFGGEVTYREEPSGWPSRGVCLTCEFPGREPAEAATVFLREIGEQVEGPVDYGPD